MYKLIKKVVLRSQMYLGSMITKRWLRTGLLNTINHTNVYMIMLLEMGFITKNVT